MAEVAAIWELAPIQTGDGALIPGARRQLAVIATWERGSTQTGKTVENFTPSGRDRLHATAHLEMRVWLPHSATHIITR